jgi:hypothetical protein
VIKTAQRASPCDKRQLRKCKEAQSKLAAQSEKFRRLSHRVLWDNQQASALKKSGEGQ